MHEKKIARMYLIELFSALGIYTVMLMLSIEFGRGMPAGILRTVILASPMVGFFLGIWAMTRQVARMDEYIRRRLLENFAMAFAITAALTFTYGFMETAGYPRLSMFAVWGVMGTSWGLVSCARGLLDR
jgi:hypothetical protein